MANTAAGALSLIPNPLTPMAFLPPKIAFELTLLKYVFVGTLGAVVWDTITSMGIDYRLLRNCRITFPTVVYFFSRFATLTYLILVAIGNTAPVGNCGKIFAAAMWVFAMAIPSTTLLFFFRVRAVYLDNKYVVGAFAIMWLGVLAVCINATQEGGASEIGPTKYCLAVGDVRGPSVSASAVIPFINDVLGFCAVTWRLTKNSQVNPTFRSSFKAMAFGHYLPTFSRALLQDGQIYFLSTVGIYVMTIMALYIEIIPPIYSAMFGISNVAVMNAMACRMYRNTKLGLYRLPVLKAASKANSSKPHALHVDSTATQDDSVISIGETQHTLSSEGISSRTKLQRVQAGESSFNSPSEKAEKMV